MALDERDAHWEPSVQRGYLPRQDPLRRGALPHEYNPAEDIAGELPILLEQRRIRQRLGTLDALDIQEDLSGQELDRLMMLYCYLASAYVHAEPGEPPAKVLPRGVAMPLVRLSDMLGRPPILLYWAYCLNNWKRTDPHGPFCFDNLELLQVFRDRTQDSGFILEHTDIEGNAGPPIVQGIANIKEALAQRGMSTDLWTDLQAIAGGLSRMNRIMDRMTDVCDPALYWQRVRPYIQYFDNVVYEGVERFHNQPQTLRGETGAQSSIPDLIDRSLGIQHQETDLVKHLKDMRRYRHPRHERFNAQMESPPSIRDAVEGGQRYLRQAYNDCLHELIRWRETHYSYASRYIHDKDEYAKKLAGPSGIMHGTGMTNFMVDLKTLIEETRVQLLPS